MLALIGSPEEHCEMMVIADAASAAARREGDVDSSAE